MNTPYGVSPEAMEIERQIELNEATSRSNFLREQWEKLGAQFKLPLPEVVEVEDMMVRQANDVLFYAAQRPDPVSLYKNIWHENELCCLFASTNLGKSILAVQIGVEIARSCKKRVLYFDYELSDKQFQRRYTDEYGQVCRFPDEFFRVERNPTKMRTDADPIFVIEMAIVKTMADVVIVDNLTWLCNACENGEDAGSLMQKLCELKVKYDISMLVISHTPKRDPSLSLRETDLAGSARLGNFFDSIFAIGRSSRDEHMRYIKQLKCRNNEIVYGSDNVILCHIERDESGFTLFVEDDEVREEEHLRQSRQRDMQKVEQQIIQLHQEGKGNREIHRQLGISRWKVDKTIKQLNGPSA